MGFSTSSARTEPQKEFKIIGAGFPRTGTKSTKKALEMLGYKVLHMEDVFPNNLDKDFVNALTSDHYMVCVISAAVNLTRFEHYRTSICKRFWIWVSTRPWTGP